MSLRKLSLPPPCVAVRSQVTRTDCGIQAVAMALGMEYADVVCHAPLAVRDGITLSQLRALGKALGVSFTVTPQADLEDPDTTGLVWIDFPDGKTSHLAYLHRGTLCDPATATIWDPAIYLAHTGAEAVLLSIRARLRKRGKEQRGAAKV